MKIVGLFILCLLVSTSAIGQIGFSKRISNPSSTSAVQYSIPADLDNDGDIDLVVHGLDDFIYFLENKTTDNFEMSHPIFITDTNNFSGPDDLIVVDFDGDGSKDIIYTVGQEVFFLQNNITSRASFQVLTPFENLPFKGINLRAVDLNYDGILDLVMLQGQTEIGWFESISPGVFKNYQVLVDNARHGFEFGDIDGDNDLDLFITPYQNSGSYPLQFLENIGGDFILNSNLTDDALKPEEIFIVDMNSDNSKDVLIRSHFPQESSHWFESNLNGTWTEHQFEIDPTDADVAIGRIDNNNFADIVTARNDTVGYFDNNLLGNYEWKSTNFHLPDLLNHVSIADLDKNGTNDIIATTGHSNNQGFIFLNEGNGNFKNPVDFLRDDGTINAYEEGAPTNGMVPIDVDGDGMLDLVTTHHSGYGRAKICHRSFRNNERGFSRNRIIAYPSYYDDYVATDYADINGDGHLDIIATNGSFIHIIEKTSEAATYDVSYSIGSDNSMFDLVPVDFDFDGDIDIVVLKSWNSFSWFENLDGQGNFSNKQSLSLDTWSGDNIHLSDIDGDNDYDIVILQNGEDHIQWYQNNNNSSFSNLSNLVEGNFNGPSKMKDIDGDGLDDLVYVNNNDQLIAHRNLGGGNMDSAVTLIAGPPLSSDCLILFEDNNGDGLDDLFIMTPYENVFYLEYSGQELNFAPIELFSRLPLNTTNICIADFTADGQLDIVAHVASEFATFFMQNFSNYPKITAKVFMDENQNGTQDNNEYLLQGQTFNLNPDALAHLSNAVGISTFATDPGYYEVSLNPLNYFDFTTPNTMGVEVNDNSNLANLCFGVTPNTNILEGTLEMTSAPTRCNTDVPFWINYKNLGTKVADVSISYHDHPLATFVSSIPAPSGIIGDSIFWNFDNLTPYEEGMIQLTLHIADENFVDELISINPKITMDAVDDNDSYYSYNGYRSWIICAVDPNDKLVEPNIRNQKNYTLFGDTLDYTVRFQNTGNDVAIDVRIEDFLDKNLDWNSLNILGASHDYRAELDMNTGRLLFHFEEIYLPDSTSNFVESQGFIRFELQHKEGLPERTYIENHAGIYFDFNSPVITNSVENILVTSQLGAIVQIPECSDSGWGSISINSDTSYFQSVLWSNGETGFEIDGLNYGTYFVDIMLYNGELLTDTFVIDQPTPFTIESYLTPEINNLANGTATVEIFDGVPPFTYQWEHDSNESTNMATNLVAGEYAGTVTDGNNCSQEFSITLEQIISSIDDEFENIYFNLSPNPSQGKITIDLEFGVPQNWKLMIYNPIGQTVRQFHAENVRSTAEQISVELEEGLFYVVLYVDDKTVSYKTVVISN